MYLDCKACEICAHTEDEATMLLCDKCDDGYHIHCLTPGLFSIPKYNWYCTPCKIKKSLKSALPGLNNNSRVEINTFFSNNQTANNKRSMQHPSSIRTKKHHHLTKKKKLPKFLMPHMFNKNNVSLFDAMKASNMIFDDDLSYLNLDVSVNMNCGSGMEKIQKLSLENKIIFSRFKDSGRKGLYLPVKIQLDMVQVIVVLCLDVCICVRDMLHILGLHCGCR